MPNRFPALRALPLVVADFTVAALLYELASPPVGLLLAVAGALVLGSVVYQLSLNARRHTRRYGVD